ncbi:Tyrosine--tRNA ligase [Labeo rohita]|uniref:Tyrosine--tRNA ligase n=1 Tax=Labeo rohita TaxID=84645 RepID=A0ABQ8MG30_LABRO|nr:Tyrosine--tRNA ligase [Labeo rohita]
MLRRNARLIPTTEKGGLATPLWTDNEFKSLLGEHMDSIVTESVRLDLTKKFGIDPEKVWSIEECKKVLGVCIRKKNIKDIICCHREFTLSLAQEQAQCIAKLKEQNKQLHTRVSCLTKKVGHNKASTKSDSNDQQSDESYPDLQSLCRQEDKCNSRRIEKDSAISVEVCGARQRAQSRVEGVETVPSATPRLQLQAVRTALGPKDIERLSQSLPSARTNFSEFRRALTSKMRLYDMSLTEVTQLMSQILTESEFNNFESAVTSELQHARKADLREVVSKILKNIMGPKIDWSRITVCKGKKKLVLEDKGPLVRIWSDGLVAEYRKALTFLDLTWSNKTLRSNLDMLAIWERDSDVKARVKIAAASFQVNTKNQQKNKCPKREGDCHYCGKPGHWMKESDPPHYTKLVGQLAEVLTVKAGQTRTHRPVRSPGKNRSATGLGGQPCGEDFLIGFSPHQFVPTSLVCVHAMMSSKAASWSKASPQTSMNKLHEDKESSE